MSKKKRPLTAEEKRRKKRSALGTWILVLIMLIGLGIMAYPTVSDWWNSFHASRAIASYSNAVENVDKEKLDEMIQAAHEYNERLLKKPNPYTMTDEDLAEYNSLLDLSGTGIIGYITIKSIGVYIPIYHGVEESVLQIAIGHIDWTSLPVGGESTHAVVSGHRGLPSAKLFTDLDQLREGDTFTITVLNQMITYEVDQIRIVEPGDISELAIAPGKDYCTLVTCTPYGINTHRLLIRGTRVANEAGELVVPAEAFRIPNYITIPAIGVPLLFLTLIILLVVSGRRKPKIKTADLYRMIEEVTEQPTKNNKRSAPKKPEAKPKNTPVKEPDVKPEDKPVEDPEVKPESEPAKEPEAKPEDKPVEEPEVKPEDEPAKEPEAEPEKEPEISAEEPNHSAAEDAPDGGEEK